MGFIGSIGSVNKPIQQIEPTQPIKRVGQPLRLPVTSDQNPEPLNVEPLEMIFIAGVSPRAKVLDQNPRRCPVCGLNQAYYRRIDHFLSLFFIPILRVKKGEPFLVCDRCEQAGTDFSRQPPDNSRTCRYCGRGLAGNFKFCPYCGKRV